VGTKGRVDRVFLRAIPKLEDEENGIGYKLSALIKKKPGGGGGKEELMRQYDGPERFGVPI